LRDAFAAELDEPVPERLLAALQPRAASVSGLDAARAARLRSGAMRQRYILTMAASVLIAVGAGLILWQRTPEPIVRRDGALVADGALASALSNRLSDASAPDGIRLGLSFRAKNGEYCRTFSLSGANASAGLACRDAERWNVRALAHTQIEGGDGGYRTAASSLPPAVLSAVQGNIAGDPLDKAGEASALAAHWKPFNSP
jgi:hypothetical protein